MVTAALTIPSLQPPRHFVFASIISSQRWKTMYVPVGRKRRMELFLARTYGFSSRLAVVAPTLADEWDENKNPKNIYPTTVSATSIFPVWWRCPHCRDSYAMAPEKRLLRGGGCPRCSTLTAPPQRHAVASIELARGGRKQQHRPRANRPTSSASSSVPLATTNVTAGSGNLLPGELSVRLRKRGSFLAHKAAYGDANGGEMGR